jgi:ubiquinone/menaquinone biosynthesis C-methylase UbiE
MDHNNYLKQVREHYEEFPYPPYDPELDKQNFSFSNHDLMDSVNYHCFEGKRDFTKPFRVLIAGGGTGTSTITWAEQLRDNSAGEVVYLDMTQTSMDICKKRAEIRGLTNIHWVHDSILEIPNLDLGKFDYICCTGVLHHLKSPDQGLYNLKSVLKDDGAMLIMVYAKYGRSAIYGMQDLMATINQGEEDLQQHVNNCKTVLKDITKDNWLNYNKEAFSGDLASDNGIYDLLLHNQDRAYSVPQLYEFMHKQNLNILDLFPQQQFPATLVYDPATYIKQPELLEKIQQLSTQQQQTICEILNGHITMHECYVTPDTRSKPDPTNLNIIPSLTVVFGDTHYQQLQEVLQGDQPNITLGQQGAGTQLTLQKTPNTHLILKFIDGKRSLQDILRKVMSHPSTRKQQPKPNNPTLVKEFEYIFKFMNAQHLMYLRDASVPAYKSIQAMQEPVCENYGNKCVTSLGNK